MKYRYVIWDWNGTLFDDSALCVSIVNGMLGSRKLPTLTLDQYRAAFTFPVQTYYHHIGFDLARESFEALSREFISAYEGQRHSCPLHPDARDVLAHVAATGRQQSLLSAYAQDTLTTLVAALDLPHFFELLIGLEDIYARGKLELAHRLLRALPHSGSDVVLIGDTLHDFEVARATGIDCVLVAHGHQARSRLEQCDVPVVDRLSDLYGII